MLAQVEVKSHFVVHPRRCLKLAVLAYVALVAFEGSDAAAADNVLTATEKADGWKLLFNGKDTTGWRNNTDKKIKAKIEDGALNPHGSGGYVVVYDKPFGDFVLRCDVKMDQPKCNSGVFLRISDLKDPVQSGFEIQVNADKKPDVHGFGSIYDLVPPSKNATRGPGKWDSLEIRCKGPKITVSVNGEQVSAINCDEWVEPGKRLDGSPNKFKMAVRDFPRSGYLGVQDHGDNVWFKNIKLREL